MSTQNPDWKIALKQNVSRLANELIGEQEVSDQLRAFTERGISDAIQNLVQQDKPQDKVTWVEKLALSDLTASRRYTEVELDQLFLEAIIAQKIENPKETGKLWNKSNVKEKKAMAEKLGLI